MDDWLKSLCSEQEGETKGDEEVSATIEKMSAIEIKEDYAAEA
jgi:hypothetical protein